MNETEADFTRFVKDRGTALLRFATALTGDRHHAEDLVQAVLERAFPKWKRISRRGDPEWYLRRSIVNAAKDGWRSDTRALTLLERVGGEEPVAVPFDDYVRRDAVRRALHELSPGQRTVIVLRYWEGLSEAETAALMDVTVGTVKSQTHRAMRALRGSVELADGPPPDAESEMAGGRR
ncbi:RNA polymerase sigma-70 factor (sigma-E family) [Actinocorallia herbida]|uniref:RNA polymerase sigma-70 factor (Sigma-E family) n=1 Tax=Actinocorallia herbida TaxID=58109 RepID=A0A3N1D6U0_9ACTN|nr:SigE family RNA polymerase sigma factor [Actinocorallia herbida]ROO89179.1 RNA polymerase sigma-70 factor (sigma-E family) [Actinocorallia herbida]